MSAEEGVLIQHQAAGPDPWFEVANQSCQTKRHPLDQRRIRAHHPIEPPEVIVARGVVRRDRKVLVVSGRRPGESLRRRTRQREHSAMEAFGCKPGRLPDRGPKPARQSSRSASAAPKCPL